MHTFLTILCNNAGLVLFVFLCSLLTIHSLLIIRPLPSGFCRLPSIIARSTVLKVEAPAEIHKRRIRHMRYEVISFRILYFGHLLAPVVTQVQVNLFVFRAYLLPSIYLLSSVTLSPALSSKYQRPISGIEYPARHKWISALLQHRASRYCPRSWRSKFPPKSG